MAPRRNPATSPARQLEQLQRRVEAWREVRTQLHPMPIELWEEATELARTLGVSPVRRAAALNYKSLRQRVADAEVASSASEPAIEFVELAGHAAHAGGHEGSTVEVERADGARLTIRVQAGSSVDIAELVAAFMRSQS